MPKIPLEKKLGFWHGLFESWGRQGLGSGQAYKQYMQMRHEILPEYRMRKTDFLKAYREYVGIPAKSERWKYVRKDYRPTEAHVVHTMRNPVRNYVYDTTVKRLNMYTNEIDEINVRISSDELIPKLDVEEAIYDVFRRTSPHIEILEIKHNTIFGRMM